MSVTWQLIYSLLLLLECSSCPTLQCQRRHTCRRALGNMKVCMQQMAYFQFQSCFHFSYFITSYDISAGTYFFKPGLDSRSIEVLMGNIRILPCMCPLSGMKPDCLTWVGLAFRE
jgi:hypothetical protein